MTGVLREQQVEWKIRRSSVAAAFDRNSKVRPPGRWAFARAGRSLVAGVAGGEGVGR